MNLNRSRVRPWLALVILSMAINASAEWNEKVLYGFQGGNDGSFPGAEWCLTSKAICTA